MSVEQLDRGTMVGHALIDCQVDHGWAASGEVMAYLPSEWRDYIGEPGSLPGGGGARKLLSTSAYAPTAEDGEADAFLGTLAPAIADPKRLAERWLEPHGIDLALLTFGAAATIGGGVNLYLAKQLVRAANDWSIERWLESDDSGRLRGSILVPEQQPEEAAKEIARAGRHPKVAAVLLGANGAGKPAGHPIWDPIYAAAVRLDLPVIVRAGGDAVQDTVTLPTSGGPASTTAELRVLAAQALMTHVSSLIVQGTFERNPNLRVVLAGAGFAWLPTILWRLDANYKALRAEAPWLTRSPSEYLRDHVRVLAAPFDGPATPALIDKILGAYPDYADVVCFGSGYPGPLRLSPHDAAEQLGPLWSESLRAGAARQMLRV